VFASHRFKQASSKLVPKTTRPTYSLFPCERAGPILTSLQAALAKQRTLLWKFTLCVVTLQIM